MCSQKKYLFLLIHHGGSFLNNKLTIYKGGIITKLSYFELVCVVKELGYWEIDRIW